MTTPAGGRASVIVRITGTGTGRWRNAFAR
jgi:hypothetical protein